MSHDYGMWFIRIILVFAGIYIAIIAAMYLAQTWLLFPTWLMKGGESPLPASAARLEVRTPEGERLAGVHLPPAAETRRARSLILGFGGNAWNADGLALYLRRLVPDSDVVAFHYRGYRPSTGRPSAAALLADALLVHDHLERTLGPMPIVAVGVSIGTGPAVYLARKRPLAGLILVSPFDSLEALAKDHYPWAPVGLLLRHRMPIATFMDGVSTPTALIAAGRDSIIPPVRTEALRRAVGRLVLDRTIPGAGHNDLYGHPDFPGAMVEALARIERARR
ncbi:MAG TPA: alpha/beta hydrolase [Alphaproteobacteria bacterium]